MLHATIKNFSYTKYLKEELKTCDFTDINTLPSKCFIRFNDKTFALSKWVSPKRTRSYPYARVYDTFSSSASKITTIIPLIKDEGINGDMDYLQWDTISLMSLLNVYVILGYYDKAESHPHNSDKITNQQFNNDYIKQQLHKLSNYHQSALHWNLNQLERDNLSKLIGLVKLHTMVSPKNSNAHCIIIKISIPLLLKYHKQKNLLCNSQGQKHK